uniref:Uncharacterized protein n=1 Tax=Noctiluca scintillans TaxID=2966 RepID=A0A7S0ZMT9_NOCSC
MPDAECCAGPSCVAESCPAGAVDTWAIAQPTDAAEELTDENAVVTSTSLNHDLVKDDAPEAESASHASERGQTLAELFLACDEPDCKASDITASEMILDLVDSASARGAISQDPPARVVHQHTVVAETDARDADIDATTNEGLKLGCAEDAPRCNPTDEADCPERGSDGTCSDPAHFEPARVATAHPLVEQASVLELGVPLVSDGDAEQANEAPAFPDVSTLGDIPAVVEDATGFDEVSEKSGVSVVGEPIRAPSPDAAVKIPNVFGLNETEPVLASGPEPEETSGDVSETRERFDPQSGHTTTVQVHCGASLPASERSLEAAVGGPEEEEEIDNEGHVADKNIISVEVPPDEMRFVLSDEGCEDVSVEPGVDSGTEVDEGAENTLQEAMSAEGENAEVQAALQVFTEVAEVAEWLSPCPSEFSGTSPPDVVDIGSSDEHI